MCEVLFITPPPSQSYPNSVPADAIFCTFRMHSLCIQSTCPTDYETDCQPRGCQGHSVETKSAANCAGKLTRAHAALERQPHCLLALACMLSFLWLIGMADNLQHLLGASGSGNLSCKVIALLLQALSQVELDKAAHADLLSQVGNSLLDCISHGLALVHQVGLVEESHLLGNLTGTALCNLGANGIWLGLRGGERVDKEK